MADQHERATHVLGFDEVAQLQFVGKDGRHATRAEVAEAPGDTRGDHREAGLAVPAVVGGVDGIPGFI